MKTTKTIEILKCDFCDANDNDDNIETCQSCGKDFCTEHGCQYDNRTGYYNEKEPLNAVSYLGFDTGNKKFNAINNEINNSTELFDRIGWELVNQQMFFSRDKDLVSDAIIELQKSIDNNADRFNEVAEAIRKIDGDNTPFFIWKNNTVDDGVERLFSRYDEELDDSVDMSIWEYMELNDDKRPFDLVIIKDEKMSFARPESLKEKPATLV